MEQTPNNNQVHTELTPMWKVWVFVVLSMLIVAVVSFAIAKISILRDEMDHRAKITYLQNEINDLEQYQGYLKRHGTTTGLGYFATDTLPTP